MSTLVVYGSKRGGTEGLATMIGEALSERGLQADVRQASEVNSVASYRAVIVAGALYAGRWHRDARRFVRRHAAELRERAVWLVSSGPLDDSARDGTLPPVHQVAKLATAVGARGTVTFGGRLERDARGFPASAMARTRSGDWRDPEQVSRFADAVRDALTESSGRSSE
jgi:menaquinone-dependent protoporphyrinogen oxidase